ncbi:hypothetical protein [Tateyamaria sp. syn59]|uniref:hypothetical protein n=1 Tax=Tateyamaria sp. syn59 TaxID=2576942 RepID=UPI0011BF32FB|nr:hypothetical protein [Tateyamaria sp. syn59]
MSDPMTNTEVEDVLASIRRLVSDDKRPEPDGATEAHSDRLVLTPALRVMEEQPQEDVVETEASVEEPQADVDDVPASEAESLVADDTAQADATDHWVGDDNADDAYQDEDGTAATVSGDIEASITLDAVDLEQDTLKSIQDAFADIDAEEGGPEGEAATHENTPPKLLSEKIAALETLIAGQTEEFEPAMVGDGENAGTEPPAIAWQDTSEPSEPLDTPRAAPEAVSETTDDAQIFSSDEDVLDEEALRDLVSDIVREELQGALGERITRNVRKLVRREIHRALAAQDLE